MEGMLLFLQGLALGFTAAASPGPFQAYLIALAVQNGWRRAWPAAFAPLLSDGPIVALALLALSAIPGWLLRGLRLAGGLFLLYLAWAAWQSLRRPDSQPPPERAAGAGLIKAALANALGPGPWLFWSTVGGPAFLAGWGESPSSGLLFLMGFYLTMLAVLSALIALFAAAGQLGPRFVRRLRALSALLLLGFAIYQLWNGATA